MRTFILASVCVCVSECAGLSIGTYECICYCVCVSVCVSVCVCALVFWCVCMQI